VLVSGLGKGVDSGADLGEAVAARRGEGLQEANCRERRIFGISRIGQNLSGRAAAVKFAEEGDEGFDERAVGIATEVAAAHGVAFAQEPDLRDAAGDAVCVAPGFAGEWGQITNAVDHDREPLLRVLNEIEVTNEFSLSLGHSLGYFILRGVVGRTSQMG